MWVGGLVGGWVGGLVGGMLVGLSQKTKAFLHFYRKINALVFPVKCLSPKTSYAAAGLTCWVFQVTNLQVSAFGFF